MTHGIRLAILVLSVVLRTNSWVPILVLSFVGAGLQAGPAWAGVSLSDTVTAGPSGSISNAVGVSAGIGKAVTVRGQVYLSRNDASSDTVKGFTAGTAVTFGTGWSAELAGTLYPRANDALSSEVALTLGKDLGLPEPWALGLSVAGGRGENVQYLTAAEQATLDTVKPRPRRRAGGLPAARSPWRVAGAGAPKNPKDPQGNLTGGGSGGTTVTEVAYNRRWGTLGLTAGWRAASAGVSWTTHGYGTLSDGFSPVDLERVLAAKNLKLPGVSTLISGLPSDVLAVTAGQGIGIVNLGAEFSRTTFATGEGNLNSLTGTVGVRLSGVFRLTGGYNLVRQDPNPDSQYVSAGVEAGF